jgi:methionyl aminopeptidase
MIFLRSEHEIELIAKSCLVVAKTLHLARQMVSVGITTAEIDKELSKFIKSEGGRPAFKGFQGYPANTCISVDEQVVHGIPNKKKLKEGSIVGVDLGVEINGYYGDAARTFPVGNISKEKQHLINVTKRSLYTGIEFARPGNRLSDISHAIQTVVEEQGYSIVRELVGHGIGRSLHEEPQIPNYGKPHRGPRLKRGMVFAIEPMVNMGNHEVVTESDNWTVSTADGSPSAHWEHTIVITDGKPMILTMDIEN